MNISKPAAPVVALIDDEAATVEAIRRAAETLHAEQVTGDGLWTRAMQRVLRRLAKERGLHPWAHRDHDDPDDHIENEEWLFDHCWAHLEDGDWKRRGGLALAAEIEWNSIDADHTLDDFLKLTVAVADLRLFIFWPPVRARGQEFDLLRDASAYTSGQRYLAISIASHGGYYFEHDAWTT